MNFQGVHGANSGIILAYRGHDMTTSLLNRPASLRHFLATPALWSLFGAAALITGCSDSGVAAPDGRTAGLADAPLSDAADGRIALVDGATDAAASDAGRPDASSGMSPDASSCAAVPWKKVGRSETNRASELYLHAGDLVMTATDVPGGTCRPSQRCGVEIGVAQDIASDFSVTATFDSFVAGGPAMGAVLVFDADRASLRAGIRAGETGENEFYWEMYTEDFYDSGASATNSTSGTLTVSWDGGSVAVGVMGEDLGVSTSYEAEMGEIPTVGLALVNGGNEKVAGTTSAHFNEFINTASIVGVRRERAAVVSDLFDCSSGLPTK